MAEHSTPDPSSDPLWKEFDDIEARRAVADEAAYRQIEAYNSIILNQIVGLEDQDIAYQGQIHDGELYPHMGGHKPKTSFMQQLYLQPDREEELIAQGESPSTIRMYHNPQVIRGKVPERTSKLVQDLLTGIEATKDVERSKPAETIWRGNIAGEPIEIIIHTQKLKEYDGLVSQPRVIDTLSVFAQRPEKETSTALAETATNALIEPDHSLVNEEVADKADESLDSSQDDTEATIQNENGRQKRWDKVRRRIFPKRRKF